MIKVNVVTLQASRVDIPLNAKGLADRTLRYLQSELNPVPPELLNIEFWPENNVTAVIDESIEKYGTEILILDEANKIVNVSREVIPLTAGELSEKQALIDAGRNEVLKRELVDLDLKSIKDMREWIATQPTAPQTLKDYEAIAIAKRNEIK